MNTYSSDALVSHCSYYAAGVYCFQGHLHKYVHPDHSMDFDGEKAGVISEPVLLEGVPLKCPICEGRSVLLTSKGREVLAFLDVFARPLLRDLLDEVIKEREQY